MSAAAFDVFSLRDSVVAEYAQFARTFTTIRDEDLRVALAREYESERFWPAPLIQLSPEYARGRPLLDLEQGGVLTSGVSRIFVGRDGAPIAPRLHQEQAWIRASRNESFVVTTGTGSGKSLCYFVPIVSAALRERASGGPRRTRAIVIYPMNALANSQANELDNFGLGAGSRHGVTYARYTGEDDDSARKRVAEAPPDILLTNFMMLELLLTRQDPLDRQVISNCEGLRFLVLDELHTYRGRQGADVALLVRRVRERLAPEGLVCIGTSATMSSVGEVGDRKAKVAEVASTLFAEPIDGSAVIDETLVQRTDSTQTLESVRPKLGAAVQAGPPRGASNAELGRHPLTVWAELTLGLSFPDGEQRLVRAKPLTLEDASARLSSESGQPAARCRAVLQQLLLDASLPEAVRTHGAHPGTDALFAYKLHQFIAGAGQAFATLEPPPERNVTLDEQLFHPAAPTKRLFAVHFCRDCGHAYHPVRFVGSHEQGQLYKRSIDDSPPRDDDPDDVTDTDPDAEGGRYGFVSIHPGDPEFTFDGSLAEHPDGWTETSKKTGELKWKGNYKARRVEPLAVKPDGSVGSGARAWFIPGRFRFCLRCGDEQPTAARDRNKLASLSAEGRSSATTMLVASVLRWMHGAESTLEQASRKILGFTDNRQDAALQAGHFNDVVFTSILRAALLRAVRAAGAAGLPGARLGEAIQRALGFEATAPEILEHWLEGPARLGEPLASAQAALREVLTYRALYDQRRGWRYTHPNLEQLGLVRVDYVGLTELTSDPGHFVPGKDDVTPGRRAALQLLAGATPQERENLFAELLDTMRRGLSIDAKVLERTEQEAMEAAARNVIRPPWGFTQTDRPQSGTVLFVAAPPRSRARHAEEAGVVRAGRRSAWGRIARGARGLRTAQNPAGRDLRRQPLSKDEARLIDDLTEVMLSRALAAGLVAHVDTSHGAKGWKIRTERLRFLTHEPATRDRSQYQYFRDFYGRLAELLADPAQPLFGFEAREHTAQVDKDVRQARERRFRDEAKPAPGVGAKVDAPPVDGTRFLPVLVCSPTMELGVDIADLNAVYLRNVPPTPANYAQRSGRAGRHGQAALVLTYCAAQSPHDQYYFSRQTEMVHGEVRPPMLDLANRDLVESHLFATWLAATETELPGAVSSLLLKGQGRRGLEPKVASALQRAEIRDPATRWIRGVLARLQRDLTPSTAPWFPLDLDGFARDIVAVAYQRFTEAFERWYHLFEATEAQREAANQILTDYSATKADRVAAEDRRKLAGQQIELLLGGDTLRGGDFNTYRYLATEGFLPGYNFPRLPLMAFVPSVGGSNTGRTYLKRPRFLALAEFGPRSLVYHEGRTFMVVRALLSTGQTRDSSGKLPAQTARICTRCGAGHFDEDLSTCHACGAPLANADVVKGTLRIENVETKRWDRITANDEERKREGFELKTTYQWSTRKGAQAADVRRGTVADGEGELATLHYGPRATITRLNLGLRRRRQTGLHGFLIDPVTGSWAGQSNGATDDPAVVARERVVPLVQDRKNALVLRTPGIPADDAAAPTLQYALLRGLESVFQLESGELVVEKLGTVADGPATFLFYEATEGGAGVLTRLVAEAQAFAAVARRALRILHFDLSAGLPGDAGEVRDEPGTACVRACYRCVLSYFNQPEHERLDRTTPVLRRWLWRLAQATTVVGASPTPVPSGGDATRDGSPLARLRAAIVNRGLPAPDAEPLGSLVGHDALVWRAHFLVATLGALPASRLKSLEAQGFEVVGFDPAQGDWEAGLSRLDDLLGRTG